MLPIPYMKPDNNQTDTTHLAIFLRNQNSYNENDILNDVARFTQLRREALAALDSTEQSQRVNLRYVSQLRAFLPRIAAMESEIKIFFSWFDAFCLTRKENATSFYFDLAACVWNLGANEAARGANIDRSSDEGVRTANKHFQQAAGYFDHIREHILPKVPKTTLPCLSIDCLVMVKQLMLAQAQLCFYEKAVRDKKKDAMKSNIIAKLALQTSVFYAAASIPCRTGTIGPFLDISWFALTDFQAKCFQGAAEYWQAVAAKEAALQRGTGYGEEVAWLNRAEIHVCNALDQGRRNNVASSLPAGAEGLLAAVQANRAATTKDLSTVYMENIPSDNTLVDITPAAMVKPLALSDMTLTEEVLFKYVLPKQIVEANRRCYEELNAIFSQTQVVANNATNFGRSTLSSVGLPGSLEAVKPENPLPEMLWQKVQKTMAMGGKDRLDGLLGDLQACQRRALLCMSTIDESLEREERHDDVFRNRYPQYPGPRTIALDQDIKGNNIKLREAYANAQRSDESIAVELSSVEGCESLSLLSKSRSELEKLFPAKQPDLLDFEDEVSSGGGLMSPAAVSLQEELESLAGVMESRQRQIDAIRALTNVDLAAVVHDAMSKNEDCMVIHTKLIQDAQELRVQIEEGIRQQDPMLKEILRLNEQFIASKERDPLLLARNAVIQRIEQSTSRFFALHAQLSAGLTFYSNLQQKLTTLQQSCDDLAYTQQWQRQEYEQSEVDASRRALQDQADREMAMRMQQQMNLQQQQQQPQAPQVQAAQPIQQVQPPATYNAYGAATNSLNSVFAPPAAKNVVNSSGLVYGTPVNGPPNVANAPAAPAAYGAYPGSASAPPQQQPSVQYAQQHNTPLYPQLAMPPPQQTGSNTASPGGYQYNQNTYPVSGYMSPLAAVPMAPAPPAVAAPPQPMQGQSISAVNPHYQQQASTAPPADSEAKVRCFLCLLLYSAYFSFFCCRWQDCVKWASLVNQWSTPCNQAHGMKNLL